MVTVSKPAVVTVAVLPPSRRLLLPAPASIVSFAPPATIVSLPLPDVMAAPATVSA